MTDEQHIHELIDQYLMGELVGQDLDKFKIRLKDDPAFLKQVQLQKAIIQSIEASRQTELKAMLKERTSKSKGIIPLNGRLLAVAATLVSLVALGFVLKYVIGFGPNQAELSQDESPANVEETVVTTDSQAVDTSGIASIDSTSGDEFPTPITNLDSAPQYVVADVEVDEEDADNVTYFNDIAEDDIDLEKLREDEEKLDGGKLKAQRDTMLGATSVMLWAVSIDPVITQRDTKTVQSTEPTKKTERFVKQKNKDKNNTEELADAMDDEVTAPAKPTKTEVKPIRIEFWHSIINFKGYKFDGDKLLLFDTPQDTKLSLTQLDGNVYLNKNGVYFRIIANSNFNQLRKVTDTTVLNRLNQK